MTKQQRSALGIAAFVSIQSGFRREEKQYHRTWEVSFVSDNDRTYSCVRNNDISGVQQRSVQTRRVETVGA